MEVAEHIEVYEAGQKVAGVEKDAEGRFLVGHGGASESCRLEICAARKSSVNLES